MRHDHAIENPDPKTKNGKNNKKIKTHKNSIGKFQKKGFGWLVIGLPPATRVVKSLSCEMCMICNFFFVLVDNYKFCLKSILGSTLAIWLTYFNG